MGDRRILTRGGLLVDPFGLRVEDVRIEDIAHALSMLCRFNGHTKKFYSVAEHSVWVSRQVAPAYQRIALLHDAAEAYIGDIGGPWKSSVYILTAAANEPVEPLGLLEDKALRVIHEALGLPLVTAVAQVREADLRMLQTEGLQLMHRWNPEWAGDVEAYGVVLEGWDPYEARERFMQAWKLYSAQQAAA